MESASRTTNSEEPSVIHEPGLDVLIKKLASALLSQLASNQDGYFQERSMIIGENTVADRADREGSFPLGQPSATSEDALSLPMPSRSTLPSNGPTFLAERRAALIMKRQKVVDRLVKSSQDVSSSLDRVVFLFSKLEYMEKTPRSPDILEQIREMKRLVRESIGDRNLAKRQVYDPEKYYSGSFFDTLLPDIRSKLAQYMGFQNDHSQLLEALRIYDDVLKWHVPVDVRPAQFTENPSIQDEY